MKKMYITTEVSLKGFYETFFEKLQERVKDPIHKENHDIIADFSDKFLLVELKRLEQKDECFSQSVEIPDIIQDPLKNKLTGAIEDFFNGMKTGSIPVISVQQDGAPNDSPIPSPEPVIPIVIHPKQGRLSSKNVVRKGNGHKIAKKRSLNNIEKDTIRTQFIALNGEIYNDACGEIQKKYITDPDISIFQITGFISHLHMRIRCGKLEVNNMPKYFEFLQKHRDLWATYNSPKYVAMRAQNVKQIDSPKFTTLPSRKSK
jgi:hypothetical protein